MEEREKSQKTNHLLKELDFLSEEKKKAVVVHALHTPVERVKVAARYFYCFFPFFLCSSLFYLGIKRLTKTHFEF